VLSKQTGNALPCVIHIERTSGTSIRQELRRMLGRDNVYWRGDNGDWMHILADPAEEFDKYAVIGGHMSAQEFDRFSREKVFLSVVRDPAVRVLSVHHMVMKSRENHPCYDAISRLPFRDAIRVPIFRDYVSDQQCRYLGDEPTFLSAKRNIQSRTMFIGIHENVNLVFDAFAQYCGWTPGDLPHDSCGDPGYERNYSEEDLKAAAEVSKEDQKLYEWLKSADGGYLFNAG
jgi:hypothetical protein